VSPKLRRILQLIADLAGRPLQDLRVLDLGCLEGGYAIELALHGAEVVGVEGRIANIEKARFAQRRLNLKKAAFFHDDIRNVSEARYGRFDVILCLGVLYHLDSNSIFDFIKQLFAMCNRLAIFDTHVSVIARERYEHQGQAFYGRDVVEFDPMSSGLEREQELWGSIGNLVSFWPSKPSLLNMLSSSGFTSILECLVPAEPGKPLDRLTLIAIAGSGQRIQSVSQTALPDDRMPEDENRPLSPEQRKFQDLRRRLVLLVPRTTRDSLKAFARRLRLFNKAPRLWERHWKERHVPPESALPLPVELQRDTCGATYPADNATLSNSERRRS
jgi:SAM-dependent methyltransferase